MYTVKLGRFRDRVERRPSEPARELDVASGDTRLLVIHLYIRLQRPSVRIRRNSAATVSSDWLYTITRLLLLVLIIEFSSHNAVIVLSSRFLFFVFFLFFYTRYRAEYPQMRTSTV